MRRLLFTSARLVDPEGDLAAEPRLRSLLVEDGRIVTTLEVDAASPVDAERIDLAGAWLAPGFLDLHFHGELAFAGAHDAPAALSRAAASCIASGSTGFLATTIALPEAQLTPLVAALGDAIEQPAPGVAQPLGIHLEGPWIQPAAAGAQPPAGIRPIALQEVRAVLEAARGRVRLVTLAPELDGSQALLGLLSEERIVPALGHSHASAIQIERAIDAGLRHVTHLFNAMSGVHHRDLGVAGVALSDDRLSCDLIADGAHVHPAMVRLAARIKGPRLVLITDRVDLPAAPGETAPAQPGLGALRSDGVALRLPDGTLAGSCLALDAAIRNVTRWGAMTRAEAIAACTLRPARLLGIESERGTLRPGARADLVVLGADGVLRETWLAGRRAYPV